MIGPARKNSIFILVALSVVLVVAGIVMTPLANKLKNSPDISDKTPTQNKPLGSPLLQEASLEEIKDRLMTAENPITLVNMWASWCGPCKVEFPGLMKLRERYKDRGFDLLLVSLDNEDQREEAIDFLKEHGVDFLSFIKGSQSSGFMQPLFPMWQGAIPASFLVNRDLTVLEGWIGETSTEQFEAKILSHLPKQ